MTQLAAGVMILGLLVAMSGVDFGSGFEVVVVLGGVLTLLGVILLIAIRVALLVG